MIRDTIMPLWKDYARIRGRKSTNEYPVGTILCSEVLEKFLFQVISDIQARMDFLLIWIIFSTHDLALVSCSGKMGKEGNSSKERDQGNHHEEIYAVVQQKISVNERERLTFTRSIQTDPEGSCPPAAAFRGILGLLQDSRGEEVPLHQWKNILAAIINLLLQSSR